MRFADQEADLSALMAEAMKRDGELQAWREMGQGSERMRDLMRPRFDKMVRLEDEDKKVALGWDGTEPAVAYDFTSPALRP
jgi:hypothetical protein